MSLDFPIGPAILYLGLDLLLFVRLSMRHFRCGFLACVGIYGVLSSGCTPTERNFGGGGSGGGGWVWGRGRSWTNTIMYIYWIYGQFGEVWRASKVPPFETKLIAKAQVDPVALAIGPDALYWGNRGNGTIMRWARLP